MKSSTINQKILKSNKTPKIKPKKSVNHIEIVVDTSGSMARFDYKLNEYITNQLQTIKDVSKENNQETKVYLSAFSDVYKTLTTDKPFNFCRSNSELMWNSTALNDAIITANHHLNAIMKPNDTAMLLIITDGYENSSLKNITEVYGSLKTCKFYDRITYAAAGPASSESFFSRGVLAPIFGDNFTSWDTSNKGFESLNVTSNNAIDNYYGGVVRGHTKMDKIFVDMSKVSKKDIKSLRQIPYSFKVWKVDAEADISSFINTKLAMPTNKRIFGTVYQPGQAFYQLSKPEKIQEGKLLIIKDKTTNNYYYGSSDVREVLGLPTNAPVRIEPQNLSNFEIYVQSTSLNRKLVRGTNLIYVKN